MKIQLDTTAKMIKVEESVNIGTLIDLLNKLLPSGEWREFKLETPFQEHQDSVPFPSDPFNFQFNKQNPFLPPFHVTCELKNK